MNSNNENLPTANQLDRWNEMFHNSHVILANPETILSPNLLKRRKTDSYQSRVVC